jgi:hypothetical protein
MVNLSGYDPDPEGHEFGVVDKYASTSILWLRSFDIENTIERKYPHPEQKLQNR